MNSRLPRRCFQLFFAFALVFSLGFIKVHSATPDDPDSDGIPTAEEQRMGTLPTLFDTDGDGAGDGAEVRAGTDPTRASSSFRIVGTPVPSANGWQISWSSVPGKKYRLQRLDADSLPVAGTPWVDFPTITATNSLISILDSAASTASARFYRVLLVEESGLIRVGEIPVSADTFQTNGVVITASGNIRIGTFSLAASAVLEFQMGGRTLTGRGSVLVGDVEATEGSFSVDSSTGWLTLSENGVRDRFIPLGSVTTVRATELRLNVLTGDLSGRGAVQNQIATAPAFNANWIPSRIEYSGEFTYTSASQSLVVNGAASFAGVSCTGQVSASLASSNFRAEGEVEVSSGFSGTSFRMSLGSFELRRGANGLPEFLVQGKPVEPLLARLNVSMSGSMDLNGNITLSAQSAGQLGPIGYNPAEVTLQREGHEGAVVAVRYRGVFEARGLQPLTLGGQMTLDGRMTPPELEGDLNLVGGFKIRPRSAEPARLRVSVKFITDASGLRPAMGQRITDDQVRAEIDRGNEVLRRAGNRFQFELVEILNLSGVSDWFSVNARSSEQRHELQKAALKDPARYAIRTDSVNVFINGSTNSGNSAVLLPDQIVLCGQGGNTMLIPHELGHYFGLWHTQGRLCGGCEEPPSKDSEILNSVPGFAGLCSTKPDTDEVSDTIPDLPCWDKSQIASFNFNKGYSFISPAQREQVDAVFFNLMSYHDSATDRLTTGQVDRIAFNANGPRFHVVERPSPLKFIRDTAGQFEFAVAGDLGFAGSAGPFAAGIQGRARLASDGTGFQIEGRMAPLTMGDFRLEGADGGEVAVTMGSDGLKVNQGARLSFKGQPITLAVLPTFSIALNGDFTVVANAAATAGMKIAGLDLVDAGFTFNYSGGIATVQKFNGTFALNTIGPDVSFHGDLELNLLAQSALLKGSFVAAGLAGAGTANISISGRSFHMDGELGIASGSGGRMILLKQAAVDMKIGANGKPVFTVSGAPDIPPLVQLGIRFTGSVDETGRVDCTAEASGNMGPFAFDPVIVSLRRENADGALVGIRYRGVFKVAGLPALTLSGQVLPDGRLVRPELEGSLDLGGGIQIVPRAAEPTKLRVSVKYILDSSGRRPTASLDALGNPMPGSLSTDDDIRRQIQTGNDILARSGNRFRFELVEIVEVAGASTWFSVDARDSGQRLALQNDALADQQRYAFRWDAVNIYINGSTGSGNSAVVLPDQIILIGQGGRATTLAHEMGHYFGLWHTQGRLCGGCNEPPAKGVPGLDGLCSSVPDSDDVADTLRDLPCWTLDQIARANFNRNYASTTASERTQVEAVFYNLMSYHDDPRDRLTTGQVDRIAVSSVGPRFHVVDAPTVLDFLSSTSARLDFKVAGEIRIALGGGSLNLDGEGTMVVEKTAGGFLLTSFDASSGLNKLNLALPGLPSIRDARVEVRRGANGVFEAAVQGIASAGGIDLLNVAGTIAGGQAVLTTTVPPLQWGDFRIEGANGSGLSATLSSSGFTVSSGARLLYRGNPLSTSPLPSLKVLSNGDIEPVSVSGSITIQGFTLNSGSFTFQRVNGITSIPNLAGSLRIPGPNNSTLANVAVSGSIQADGSYALAGQTDSALPLPGLPVSQMQTAATVHLSNQGLAITGGFLGGILASVPSASGSGSLAITASGETSISGNVSFAPLVSGPFRIEPTSGGNFSATLSSSGLATSGGIRVLFNGVALTTASLPGINIPANGNFTTSSGPGTVTIAGFRINNCTFTLSRSSGVISVAQISGSLQVPGLNNTTLASVNVIGTIASDGTYSVTGTSSSNLTLANLPISQLQSGASLTLNNQGLTLTGGMTGGVLAQLPTPSATGNLSINANGTMAISGTVSFTPLIAGPFRIEPSTGGNFSATLSSSGITTSGGTRVLFNGVALTTVALPSITIPANGNFTTSSGAGTVTIAGFRINNCTFTVRRNNGVITIEQVSGTLAVPGPNNTTLASINVTGSISSAGDYSVTGTSASNLTLANLPVSQLQSGASVTLNNQGLLLTGGMTGGVIAQLPSPSVTGNLSINSSGAMAISGTVSFTPLIAGPFRIEPSAGGNFSATLSSSGITTSGGTRVLFNGVALTTVALPSITIPANGNFTTSSGAGTVTIAGFRINNCTFTVRRNNGVITIEQVSGSLAVPGPNNTTLASINVTGSISSAGDYSVTGTSASNLTLANLPVSQLQSGASVTLNNQGLLLTGGMTGGVIAQLPSPSVAGNLSINSSGAMAISGTVSFTPLIAGPFRIEPSAGGNFSATLSSSGITTSGGTRVLFNGVALTSVALPSITIPANGNFTTSSGAGTVTIAGFRINNCTFTVRRNNGVITIEQVSGSLVVPGPNNTTLANINVTGSISSAGAYSVTGTSASNLTLANLPVTQIQSGASVSLTPSELALNGTLSGGVLGQVPLGATATGKLSITSSGVITPSGTITIAPFVNAPFRVDSSTGGNMSATLGLSGLTVSAGARLQVTGVFGSTVVLPSFTIPTSGNFNLSLNPPSMTIVGIPMNSISCTLVRSGGVLSVNPIQANLNMPGFSQRLSGSISSSGNVSLDYGGSLTLAGFAATDGSLRLRNSGLSAAGGFNLLFAGHSFGTVQFSGNINFINNSVSYNLGRTSGGITIGGFSIPSPSISLNSAGYAGGSANLPYGALTVPLQGLRISPTTGLSFDDYTKGGIDSGWVKNIDVPLTDNGDTSTRLKGSVKFSKSGNSFTAILSYTWAGWVVYTDGCDFFGQNCTTHYPPSNIDDISSPPRFSSSGSIGTDGKFTIGGRNGFPGTTFGPFW